MGINFLGHHHREISNTLCEVMVWFIVCVCVCVCMCVTGRQVARRDGHLAARAGGADRASAAL